MIKRILPIMALLLISGCISPAEKEFNDSGRAKAIEDETDLWMVYEDQDAAFSIKYPHDVTLNERSDGLTLLVESAKVETLEGTMGYNKETAEKNVESLNNGEYGEDVDWPIESSKKVRTVSSTSAQDFMVLSRFDVCSIVFERKLYFFNNDNQVVVTLLGPKDEIIESSPDFFKIDSENCGEEKVWDLDKQDEFYDELKANAGSEVAQNWFNLFDRIVNTISFEGEAPTIDTISLLNGKWISLDDDQSAIEFNDGMKFDYYADEPVFEASFEVSNDGKYLITTAKDEEIKYEIMSISNNYLDLLHLPRGNILKYMKESE